MILPYDMARCHNNLCPERLNCLRWIERKTDDPRVHHVESACAPNSFRNQILKP